MHFRNSETKAHGVFVVAVKHRFIILLIIALIRHNHCVKITLRMFMMKAILTIIILIIVILILIIIKIIIITKKY